MKYRVVVMPKALLQASQAATWWAENRSIDQAVRWDVRCEDTLESLCDNPQRHPLAPEHALHSETLRQIKFGVGRKPTHRAVFYVRGDVVYVMAIRHLAQQGLTLEDF